MDEACRADDHFGGAQEGNETSYVNDSLYR